MKRKMMAVLMILVLLSTLPLSVSADCAHGNLIQDTAGEVHMQTCGDCGEIVTSEAHLDENGDGACDATWCQKVLVTKVQEPENTGECKHEVVNLCVCAQCGEPKHTVLWTVLEDYHYQGCISCGAEISSQEAHVDADGNGVCDICAYDAAYCKHENKGYGSDADGHWRICMDCTGYVDYSADGPHTGDPCTVCGYESCKHSNVQMYKNQYGHQQFCNDCGTETIPWVLHSVPCDVCNYAPCTDGNHSFGTEGYELHACQLCGFTTNCTDTNKDCLCDLCGNENHNYGNGYQSNETQHWFQCEKCGNSFETENHTGVAENGLCTVCGYGNQEACPHPEERVTYAYGNEYHIKYCTLCGADIGGEEAHSGVPCETCGYAPCPDGQHVFGSEGWEKHWCTKCGYYSDCEDSNKDCKCDICENEYHISYTVTKDEKHHILTCQGCGIQEAIPHFDENKDGYCDFEVCNAAMNGSNPTPAPATNDDGLDNVPKTGDISVVFLGISLMLMTTCAVAVKKIRSV